MSYMKNYYWDELQDKTDRVYNMGYVYIQTEKSPDLFTVGFYEPNGKWIPESDHGTREDAAERVRYLNGD